MTILKYNKKGHLKKDARHAGKPLMGCTYTFPTISNSD
jgi:hypothetical protein